MSKRKSCGLSSTTANRNATEVDDWNWDQTGGTWVIQKCIPDPALDMNPRILANLLANEENYLSVNYFKNGTQMDVKPWMRRMVTTWMLEVKIPLKKRPLYSIRSIRTRWHLYVRNCILYKKLCSQLNLHHFFTLRTWRHSRHFIA